jgi:hypothetical protein
MRFLFAVVLWINLILSGLATFVGTAAMAGGSAGLGDVQFLVGAATIFTLSILGLLLVEIAGALTHEQQSSQAVPPAISEAALENLPALPPVGTIAPAGQYRMEGNRIVRHAGGAVAPR